MTGNFSVGIRLDAAVEAVKAHLEANRYSYSMLRNHLRCYQLLKAHLKDKGKTYDKHEAKEWLEGVTPCRNSK
jgi:phage portal protein BeeE